MVIYEVNIQVDDSIAEEYLGWLTVHVDEMKVIDGFLDARVFKEFGSDQGASFCVHYFVQSIIHLDSYFKNKSEDMRSKFPQKFNGHFKIERRILEPLEAFQN